LRKIRAVRKTKMDGKAWMSDHPQKDVSEAHNEYSRRYRITRRRRIKISIATTTTTTTITTTTNGL